MERLISQWSGVYHFYCFLVVVVVVPDDYNKNIYILLTCFTFALSVSISRISTGTRYTLHL